MEFALSEEQRLLQDSICRYLESECNLDRVREAAENNVTQQAEVWQGLSELGIQGIIIPEEQAGVGLGFLDAALVAEALGRSVAPVPFIGSSIMAPVALMAAGSDDQKEAWLPKIAAGDVVFGVGVTEQIAQRETTGIKSDGGKLTGKAMFVIDGVDANMLIIADDDGALYLVDVNAAGVTRQNLKTIDKTRAVAEIVLEGAAAEVLPGSQNDREPLLKTIDAGRLMLAADTLGAADIMLEKAVAYAKERKQFDRVIGSFQAVKHMCAEMATELEPCRSLIWYAAHAVYDIPDEARLLTCHSKAHLSEVGRFVAKTSTEVHGGMGFTDLLGLHYWFKRIGLDRQLLGAPELIREQAAAVQGW
ncbi:MAG: acyl-CoA/acyl-ACP dehydrogenase [Pseudomonadales bacterium]|nr:acyl-CoA/acyl-ACP dehydrogenase [Pseudomonadales bacterium]